MSSGFPSLVSGPGLIIPLLVFQYHRWNEEKCHVLNPHRQKKHSLVGTCIMWTQLNNIQFVETYKHMIEMVQEEVGAFVTTIINSLIN